MSHVAARRVARTMPIACALLLVAAAAWPSVASTARGRPKALPSDFNGDGYADLAIGSEFEGVGGVSEAGSVNVLYGSTQGLTATGNQRFTEAGAIGGIPHDGERFGYSLATGDFDGDGFADLAIGSFEEQVNGHKGTGAVFVAYGSPTGLTAAGSHRFDERAFGRPLTSFEGYGETLAVGDLDGNGDDDVVVGAPGSGNGTADGIGSVGVLYGSSGGVTSAGSTWLTRPGTPDEAGEFGQSLAIANLLGDPTDDLVVGEPEGAVGSVQFAGDAWVFAGGTSGLSTSGTQFSASDFGEAPKLGNDFGIAVGAGDVGHDSSGDLIVDEDVAKVGTKKAAGEVLIAYGGTSGLGTSTQILTEGTPGVPGVVATGHGFGDGGFAVADVGNGATGDLVIGSSDQRVGGVDSAGALTVVYGGSGDLGPAGGVKVNQGTAGVPGPVQDFAFFGSQPVAANFGKGAGTDLAFSAYRADVGTAKDAGDVFVTYGGSAGLRFGHTHLFTQDTPGVLDTAEIDDYFGHALA